MRRSLRAESSADVCYNACTAMDAVEKAGCSPGLFLFCTRSEREGGCDDRRKGHRTSGEAAELSALQSRKDRGDGALPAVPVQVAGAYAAAAGRNRAARARDRLWRITCRGDVPRRALSIDSRLRWRANARQGLRSGEVFPQTRVRLVARGVQLPCFHERLHFAVRLVNVRAVGEAAGLARLVEFGEVIAQRFAVEIP